MTIAQEMEVRRLWISVLLTMPAFGAPAQPPPGLDAYVEEARSAFAIPGIAIVLIENGDLTVAKGFGVRRTGAPGLVDEHTQFRIGSNTKAFTAAALSILVDEGKIRWDDRVTDHVPGFQMYDPWVTREITVRDLLVHRSGLGLGEGDLLFFPTTDYSRADLVHQLRFLKPVSSFRSGYAYDNVLYIAAGEVVHAATGMSWEEFIQQRILDRVGMSDSVPSLVQAAPRVNRSALHGATDGQAQVGGTLSVLESSAELGANAAPAGGIATSAVDMARWLKVQLDDGKLTDGSMLYSVASAREMQKPQTLMPLWTADGAFSPLAPSYMSYGFGWIIQDYRGHRTLQHTGGVSGQRSAIAIVPEANAAIAVLTNAESAPAAYAILFRLLDHVLGLPSRDWISPTRERVLKQDLDARDALKRAAADVPSVVGKIPVTDLHNYEGDYKDSWYGKMTIQVKDGGLSMRFDRTPTMTGVLTPWSRDTFRVHWHDRTIEDAYVTFSFKPDNTVSQVRMRAVSPLADFSFDYQDLDFAPIRKTAP
jgi:CubicO group peptidase (beta-lactamase class C family)